MKESADAHLNPAEKNSQPVMPAELAGLPIEKTHGITKSPSSYIIGPWGWPRHILMELLEKAKAAKQAKRKSKLEKLMTLFETHEKLNSDLVEKLLGISRNTAVRYLSLLEKEGILRKEIIGGGTFYSKIQTS